MMMMRRSMPQKKMRMMRRTRKENRMGNKMEA